MSFATHSYHHHYHLQGLSLLASSVLIYQVIFFLNLQDYVFLLVDIMKVVLEL
jgi:hypothetical protein